MECFFELVRRLQYPQTSHNLGRKVFPTLTLTISSPLMHSTRKYVGPPLILAVS